MVLKNKCLIKNKIMKDLNEIKLLELSTKDSMFVSGGGLGTGSSSLFRSSVYIGVATTHAVLDFASGFIDRFTANATK